MCVFESWTSTLPGVKLVPCFLAWSSCFLASTEVCVCDFASTVYFVLLSRLLFFGSSEAAVFYLFLLLASLVHSLAAPSDGVCVWGCFFLYLLLGGSERESCAVLEAKSEVAFCRPF